MYACMHVLYAWVHVCTYVLMYVCACILVYVCIYFMGVMSCNVMRYSVMCVMYVMYVCNVT